jgi:hypothetical protein
MRIGDTKKRARRRAFSNPLRPLGVAPNVAVRGDRDARARRARVEERFGQHGAARRVA